MYKVLAPSIKPPYKVLWAYERPQWRLPSLVGKELTHPKGDSSQIRRVQESCLVTDYAGVGYEVVHEGTEVDHAEERGSSCAFGATYVQPCSYWRDQWTVESTGLSRSYVKLGSSNGVIYT